MAIFLLLLAGFLIFLYYLLMFQDTGRLYHFFGILAGLWLVFGIFMVTAGMVGFGYFLFFIVILSVGWIIDKLVPEDLYGGFLDSVYEQTNKLPSVSKDSYKRLPMVKDLNQETGLGALTFFLVFILYFLFLMTPVALATSDTLDSWDEEEKILGFIPYVKQQEYKSGNDKVVIVSIRMIPISSNIIDNAIDKAEPKIEEYIKEKYGDGAEIEKIEDDDIERNGHDAIQKVYNVYERTTFGRTRVGTMLLEGWYCSNNLKTMAVAIYSPSSVSATKALADDISCH